MAVREVGILLISALLAVAGVNCAKSPSGPGVSRIQVSFRQVGGCISKVSSTSQVGDSSFAYEFNDTLHVSFMLSGNCCPDSDRFAMSYDVRSDSLFVTATDTAARMCLCTCSYILQAKFANLPLDRYTFVCIRPDDTGKVY